MSFKRLCDMPPIKLDRLQWVLRRDVAAKIHRRDALLQSNGSLSAINRLSRDINTMQTELQQIDLLIGDKRDADVLARQAASKFFQKERKQ